MRMHSAVLVSALFSLALAPGTGFGAGPNLGKPISPADLAPWDIDIEPSGSGLPAGSGSVSHGREVFQNQCAACHGDKGQGGVGDRLAGGRGTLATSNPVKTVGSYWPYATTLFDYIRRAMPYNAPRSLKDEEVYALTAYILALNKLIGENDVMDAKTLPQVKMPNRDNFIMPYPDRI